MVATTTTTGSQLGGGGGGEVGRGCETLGAEDALDTMHLPPPSQRTSPPSLNLTAPVDRRGGSDLFGCSSRSLQPI